MTTKIEINQTKGSLIGYNNEEEIGRIEFVLSDNNLIVEHTLVPKEHEGKGYAKTLTQALIEYVKEQKGMSIIPQCPYTKAFFERNPQHKEYLLIKE